MRVSAQEAYDAIAPIYDYGHVDAKDIAENRVIRSMLEPLILPAGNIVDVGCGTGFLVDLFRDPEGVDDIWSDRYLGLDVSSGMLERASAKWPRHRFELADVAERWPMLQASADVVVSLFGSASYVLKPWRLVDAMADAMIPGGRFFVMLYGPRHVHRYSYLAEHEGFVVPRRLYKAHEAAVLWSGPNWEEVRVQGMSAFVDEVRRLPGSLVHRLLQLESATIDRWRPNLGRYIIVTGRRSYRG